MKKLVSGLLAVVMVLSISVSAFAQEVDTTPGTYKASDGGSLVITSTDSDSYTFNLEGKVYKDVVGGWWPSSSYKNISTDGKVKFTEGQYMYSYTTADGEPAAGIIGCDTSKYLLLGEDNNFYIATEAKTDGNTKYYNVLKAYKKASSSTFAIDTGSKISVKAGNTYQFKITSPTKPTFACGNSSVFKIIATSKSGNNYYFKVKAVGKAGQSTGFYVNGSKTPCTVGTIS